MAKIKSRYRHPEAAEQEILDGLCVRLIGPEDVGRFDQLVVEHHYLKNANLVGEHMRYVAEFRGQWLALGAWCAASLHLRGRDRWIDWSDEQRGRRLPLVVNNARLLSLPGKEVPNLLSRFMKGMLQRLNADWLEQWGHPVAVAETFVDHHLFQGTCYKVSGWIRLNETAGYKRCAGGDYYQAHNSPKTLWVKELEQGACEKLRSGDLPPDWAEVEARTPPRCRAKPQEIESLLKLLQEVPEFRKRAFPTYPVAGMLALIAIATLAGVVRGQRDLAAFARTLSQAQMRALKFRSVPRSKKREAPGETTFQRVLSAVDAAAIERVLLIWQEQVLGKAEDQIIAIDGKKLRHAGGVELVSAFGVESGRWLGSVSTAAKSNEIPAARELIGKLDICGKTLVFDALHTQRETAGAVVFDGGGDYVFTVKDNQPGLKSEVERLLDEQPFSPS
jgi:hypothetical protein